MKKEFRIIGMNISHIMADIIEDYNEGYHYKREKKEGHNLYALDKNRNKFMISLRQHEFICGSQIDSYGELKIEEVENFPPLQFRVKTPEWVTLTKESLEEENQFFWFSDHGDSETEPHGGYGVYMEMFTP